MQREKGRRHNSRFGDRQDTDSDITGDAAGDVIDFNSGVIEIVEEGLSTLHQNLTAFSQCHAAPAALEHLPAENSLQLSDQLANRRLREVGRHGSALHAASPRNGEENREMTGAKR
jgi:hypothetical protein